MAFGRLERRRADAPISDINMTPLIDVMLVLLVIFMITAPLMTSSLKLELPEAEGAQPTEQAPEAIRLSLQANGALGGQTVAHVHLHVVPRHEDDGITFTWPRQEPPAAVLAGYAERLRAAL